MDSAQKPCSRSSGCLESMATTISATAAAAAAAAASQSQSQSHSQSVRLLRSPHRRSFQDACQHFERRATTKGAFSGLLPLPRAHTFLLFLLFLLLAEPAVCSTQAGGIFLQASPSGPDGLALPYGNSAVLSNRQSSSSSSGDGDESHRSGTSASSSTDPSAQHASSHSSRSDGSINTITNDDHSIASLRNAGGALAADLQQFAVPHSECEGSVETWYCDGPFATRTVDLDRRPTESPPPTSSSEGSPTKVLMIPKNFPAIDVLVRSSKAFQLTLSDSVEVEGLEDSKPRGAASPSLSQNISVVNGQKQGSSFVATLLLHGSHLGAFNVEARGEAALASYFFGRTASSSSSSSSAYTSGSDAGFNPNADADANYGTGQPQAPQRLELHWTIRPCPKAPIGCSSFSSKSPSPIFLPLAFVTSHPAQSFVAVLLFISIATAAVTAIGRFPAKSGPHMPAASSRLRVQEAYECISVDDVPEDSTVTSSRRDSEQPSRTSWTGHILGRNPSKPESLRVMRQIVADSPRPVPAVALPPCSARESSTYSSEPMSYLSQASAYLSPRFQREGYCDASGLSEDLYRCMGLRRGSKEHAPMVQAKSFPSCDGEPNQVVLKSLQKLQSHDRDLRDASKPPSRRSTRRSVAKAVSGALSGDLPSQALAILEELIQARGEGDGEVPEDSDDIQEDTCHQLEMLSHDLFVRATLIESSEAIPTFVAVVADWQVARVSTAHTALSVLSMLTSEQELVSEVYHAECVPVLLRLICNREVTDQSLVLKAFLELRNLCSHRALRHQFANQRIGKPPEKALPGYVNGPLKRYSDNIEISTCAVGLLGLLAFEDQHRVQLIEAGAAEHLLEMMEKHPDSQTIHLVAIMALLQLNRRSGDRAALHHLHLEVVVQTACEKFPELATDESVLQFFETMSEAESHHQGSPHQGDRRAFSSVTSTHHI